MSKTEKTELGLPPYYIHAENRIKELGLAIARNAHQARTPYQRNAIIEWAREITLQIAIIETLEQPTITPEEMERIHEALKKETTEIMTKEECMTLDEAIKHCHEKANDLKNEAEHMPKDSVDYKPCLECASEHEQLARWLEELKERREGRDTCEFCKHNFRLEKERPCSICKHNFVNQFERKDTGEEE